MDIVIFMGVLLLVIWTCIFSLKRQIAKAKRQGEELPKMIKEASDKSD